MLKWHYAKSSSVGMKKGPGMRWDRFEMIMKWNPEGFVI